MPFIEKKIVSGNLVEIEQYFAPHIGKQLVRSPNQSPTPEKQEELNTVHARKKLVRLINTNFSHKNKDLFATFCHQKEVTEQEAKKEIEKLIRAVRKYRREHGLPELKYILITEHQGKWHHHLILNNMPIEDLFELWEHGRTQVSILDDCYSYKDLAVYLTTDEKSSRKKNATPQEQDNAKEPRRKHAKRWSCSRNLEKPKEFPPKIISKVSCGDPKAPKGYRLLPDWVKGCDSAGNPYMAYSYVIETPRAGNNKKKRRC
ncbi:rolling circle replication-associated protein [Acetanaerobacterium elongatum]|uniref:rolling circle replication-associated protein n=1 Tax=Acetanaerobacterium elongatum TaxID=258515 RepID=UPI00115FCB9F|nr:hypothetical protein [Acetanaerobacterium elongatum]